ARLRAGNAGYLSGRSRTNRGDGHAGANQARITSGGSCSSLASVGQPAQSAAAPASDSGWSAVTAELDLGSGSAAVKAATAISASSTWLSPFAVVVTNASHSKMPEPFATNADQSTKS